MTGEATSDRAKWTDADKLKVMFSLIAQVGKIDWDKVDIPEGRSIKAVKCMLDIHRKKIDPSRSGGPTPDGTPKKPKASPKKTSPKKRAANDIEVAPNTQDDEEILQKKRIKLDLGDTEEQEEYPVKSEHEELAL